jgi:hypothetical protein
LFLQHFTGTLDNWDPAVTDPLAQGRTVILFLKAPASGTLREKCQRRLPEWQITP